MCALLQNTGSLSQMETAAREAVATLGSRSSSCSLSNPKLKMEEQTGCRNFNAMYDAGINHLFYGRKRHDAAV